MAFDGWRVELFGGLRAVRSTDAVEVTEFRTKKCEQLLAMLASKPGRAWGREELGELLWPGDDDPSHQRELLRYNLAKIKVALHGDDVIVRGGNTWVSADPERLTSDVAAFDAAFDVAFLSAVRASTPAERLDPLREAVRLYRDDLLPDFYDEWSCRERERLREGLFAALTRLLLDLETVGRTDEALARRRDAVARFPDRALPQSAPISPNSAPVTVVQAAAGSLYFGRDAEKDTLRTWAESGKERLLTLVGPGGMGKTRLSREALGPAATFVSLAEVFEPGRIYEAIHSALSLPPHQGDPYIPLVAALNGLTQPRLILDNLEQIVDGAAPLVERLLRDAPALKILATSRKRLALGLERVMALNPLPDGPSVALFLDRARLARPDFLQTPETLATVGELIVLLEGLPLAIELAAARTVVLGPRQILSQLQNRLNFLVNRRYAPVERHSSLRAALDWSFELLTPEQRQFFARLSVFRGGFTLEAAEAVAGDCVKSTLDTLDDLHSHSLLTVSFNESNEARYDLLVVIREYAEEIIEKSEEIIFVKEKYTAYFKHNVESIDEIEFRQDKTNFVKELDNFRRMRTIMVELEDEEGLFNTFNSVAINCFELGYWSDFRAWLKIVSEMNINEKQKLAFWGRCAAYAQRSGDMIEAERYWKLCLENAVAKENWDATVNILQELAGISIELGRLDQAQNYLNQEIYLTQQHKLSDRVLLISLMSARLSCAFENREDALEKANIAWSMAKDIDHVFFVHYYLIFIYRKMKEIRKNYFHLEYAMRIASENNLMYPLARLSEEAALFFVQIDDMDRVAIAVALANKLHETLGILPRREFQECPQIGLCLQQQIGYNGPVPSDNWQEYIAQLWHSDSVPTQPYEEEEQDK